MKLYAIRSYLYYLSRAQSEYYVHSPYVYSLMTQCIKGKSRFHFASSSAMMKRLSEYVAPQGLKVQLIEHREDLSNYVSKALPPDTVLLIDAPHSDKKREAAFDSLCNRGDIPLSIDVFFYAMIFPSIDIEKEHFVLNYY